MTAAKPASRPNVPHFSSGPCAKRPGWNAQNLKDAALGRSHRAKIGKAKLKLAIELTREVLEVPAGYRIGIVPASDTGAVEMSLWSLLGARPVTTIAWESFGEGWVGDIVKELKLRDVTKLHAGYGEIPDLSKADPASDIVFTWNGTTSGVRVPNADWISAKREGLTICDATSAAFAQVLDDWKAKTPWIDFLAKDPAIRSNTSVCMKVVDPAITALTADAQADFAKRLVALVEKEGAGYDFAHYRDAPAGLRVWCGATVEAKDVALLTQWIDWAFAETKAALPKAA